MLRLCFAGLLFLVVALCQTQAFSLKSISLQKNAHGVRAQPTILSATRIPMSMEDNGLMERARKRRKGVAVIDRPKEDVVQDTETEIEEVFEKQWRVVLHNDIVHTFDFVNFVLRDHLPELTRAMAHELALAAHIHGESTLEITHKKRAQELCFAIQTQGLTVSVVPDGKGDGNKGDGKE
ncbi:unnamed protein product [Heterosigma akashiwo]